MCGSPRRRRQAAARGGGHARLHRRRPLDRRRDDRSRRGRRAGARLLPAAVRAARTARSRSPSARSRSARAARAKRSAGSRSRMSCPASGRSPGPGCVGDPARVPRAAGLVAPQPRRGRARLRQARRGDDGRELAHRRAELGPPRARGQLRGLPHRAVRGGARRDLPRLPQGHRRPRRAAAPVGRARPARTVRRGAVGRRARASTSPARAPAPIATPSTKARAGWSRRASGSAPIATARSTRG